MDLLEQLNYIFYPKAIAVIGASASTKKLGFMCVSNLMEAGFKGRVYPVNPKLSELLGLRAYPSLGAIPGEVDLAIVAVPAQLTIPAIEDCVNKEVKGALVISSGFKEAGTRVGLDLQTRLRDIANRGKTKIIGPNTMGILNTRLNLVASFQTSLGLSKVGRVAVVAQSGGMSIYITHALTNHNIGVSKVIGLGNRCNLDFDEIVTYLAEDEETRVIVLYVEGLEEPKRLMKVAREVVKRKPIVVYKSGKGEESNRASLSHTGALVGNYELYRTAFTQSGMIVVDNVSDLVDIAKALDLQPSASGNRIAILSAQAGPGIVMTDRCSELGLRLAKFSPVTWQRLRRLVPPFNAIDNPVDIAWKSSEFEASLDILKTVLDDEGVDAVIVAVVFYKANMQLMKAVTEIARENRKPITVCLDSPCGVASSELDALEKSGVPTYPLPERAVNGLAGLVRYGEILKAK